MRNKNSLITFSDISKYENLRGTALTVSHNVPRSHHPNIMSIAI